MKYLFVIGLFWIAFPGWGQSGSALDGNGSESYALFTDRGVYVAGEWIRFRVFNTSSEVIRENNWSTVFYTELVSPEGTSVSRIKLPLDGSGTSGAIEIPQDIPSGTYYLKGYTRWMRNRGPSSYRFLSLEIINPYSRELLPVDTLSETSTPFQRSGGCPDAGLKAELYQGPLADRGAMAELNLSLNRGSDSLECCISVVRKGALQGQWLNRSTYPDVAPAQERFLPETDGITLTGRVVDGNGDPASYAVVYLSSLGDGNEFFAGYSDAAGDYYFALPEGIGETEYFISASRQGTENLNLLVDQDFCMEPVTLPAFPLRTPETEPSLLQTLSINAQIRSRYHLDSVQTGGGAATGAATGDAPGPVSSGSYFYGAPGVVIRFDDFIQLPRLEEYFTEVIPQVSLIRREGVRMMRVRGPDTDLQLFDPLVMVDGVAVFDVEAVLAISPRLVERVEIVSSPYIRGNVIFGGIVHLITRDRNMGYMDLPASGLLVEYQRFAGRLPAGPGSGTAGSSVPDVRNTVYWEPAVKIGPGNPVKFSFRVPDEAGAYEIWIRGVDGQGTCMEKVIGFTVQGSQSRER